MEGWGKKNECFFYSIKLHPPLFPRSTLPRPNRRGGGRVGDAQKKNEIALPSLPWGEGSGSGMSKAKKKWIASSAPSSLTGGDSWCDNGRPASLAPK